MPSAINKIRNYFFPATSINEVFKKETSKNLNNYIAKVQFQRLRHDISMWRAAIVEAEQAYYPHRIRMQRMFIDNILNGHTEACWNRRKNLTLLRDFKLCNKDGEENEEAKKILSQQWFINFVSFVLDAQAFGYSLISLGDIIDDNFSNVEVIRRWNVSPDRLNVTSYIYALSGINFLEDEEAKKWNIWVPTVNEIGTSSCGYGLLYKVALYEIYLRNVLGFNVDYTENYGMPIRVGKTTKTEEAERGVLAQALQNMGSEAWILLDSMDEVELVESKGTGQGYKVYENLEQRCEKKISKIILGHADALDSIPGKLGGGSGEDSPVYQALEDMQVKDARFVEPIINGQLLPRMREFGFSIPDDLHFEYVNDQEKEEFRQREDASNKVTAEIAQTMKNAGLQMNAKYFEERTGIPATNIEVEQEKESVALTEKIKNKMNKIYGKAK
jgi:hypothetical protein